MEVAPLPAVFHLLLVVLAALVVWMWFTGTLGMALVASAIAVPAAAGAVLAAAYAWQVVRGRSPAKDMRRVRASVARRSGHPSEAAARYAEARDASGIRRVALDATDDDDAADALADAAEAYFALAATVATGRRHGVVPEALLERAGDAAEAAAAQLWRSCDRLAVIGRSQSPRIEEALDAYERAVGGVRAAFESARDGLVLVAVGGVLEAQLAEIADRLGRLDRAARAIDEALADAFS